MNKANDLIDRLRAASARHEGRCEQAASLEAEAADAIEDMQEAIKAGGELLIALRRYGFPVSGAANVALGAWGSAEGMALDHNAREFAKFYRWPT
jgi:hypothetical protein